jgi:hypothetical protein
MMEKSGSCEVGCAAALEEGYVALPWLNEEAAAGAEGVGRIVMVASMYFVLVLVTSFVSAGLSPASTVTVTFSTSVVVTVRLEQTAAASGVASCLLANDVTVTFSYCVLVTVWRLASQADSAKARLASGKTAKMADFMVDVYKSIVVVVAEDK